MMSSQLANQGLSRFPPWQALDNITKLSYKLLMNLDCLKQARFRQRQTQQQVAARLGVTQAYYSMLESGARTPSAELARKLMREYHVSPVVLPVSETTTLNPTPSFLARELAALDYPGFAHLRRGSKKVNPAQFLLLALKQNNLEARVAEGLPWLVFRYPDMDFNWLTAQARMNNLQNRLGFTVTLAKMASHNADLEAPEQVLTESKLAKEDTFCRELNEPERRWLRENRSEEARQWNLLSDLRPDQLRYVA